MKFKLLWALALALLATACGNKGPLYMPQRPDATAAKPKPATPANDDSKAPADGARP